MGQLLCICCILAGVEVSDDFDGDCGDVGCLGCCRSDSGFDGGGDRTDVIILSNYNTTSDLPSFRRSRYRSPVLPTTVRQYMPEVEQQERRRQREQSELQRQRQRRNELFSTSPPSPPPAYVQ